MEWVVLVLLAIAATALVALPSGNTEAAAPPDEALALVLERDRLRAELREVDEDASMGRISAVDRSEGRRALAPRLRAATEALRALVGRDAGASSDDARDEGGQ